MESNENDASEASSALSIADKSSYNKSLLRQTYCADGPNQQLGQSIGLIHLVVVFGPSCKRLGGRFSALSTFLHGPKSSYKPLIQVKAL